MNESEGKREYIKGVFSSQEIRRVGTGTTSKKSITKTLWFVQELEDGQVELQPLNINYIPSGPKRKINKDEFLNAFSPEPELYVTEVYPKMRELNKTIARAERHRKNNELFSAEMEFNQALRVDEDNIRANFGLGITYLERGETAKADNIFSRLVQLEAAFEPEHKHLFNEFGISLRKAGMLDQALTYYEKAKTLTQNDAHLYYNLARVYFDKKDLEKTTEYLMQSLQLNPQLEVSIKFLVWLIQQKLIPDRYQTAVIKIVQTIKKNTEEKTPKLSASSNDNPAKNHNSDAAPSQ